MTAGLDRRGAAVLHEVYAACVEGGRQRTLARLDEAPAGPRFGGPSRLPGRAADAKALSLASATSHSLYRGHVEVTGRELVCQTCAGVGEQVGASLAVCGRCATLMTCPCGWMAARLSGCGSAPGRRERPFRIGRGAMPMTLSRTALEKWS